MVHTSRRMANITVRSVSLISASTVARLTLDSTGFGFVKLLLIVEPKFLTSYGKPFLCCPKVLLVMVGPFDRPHMKSGLLP